MSSLRLNYALYRDTMPLRLPISSCVNACTVALELFLNYYTTFRCKQLQDTTNQLEHRNSSLELKFAELTQKLLQCQAREVDLRDQLASSLPLTEKASLESQIEGMKKKEAELKLRNSQLQEVAEVSRQQVVALEMRRKSNDLELSSLRHQLLDVQMQSEERSVIGKLHHQIVALQVNAHIH